HPGRQRLAHEIELGLHRFGDLGGVFADALQRDPQDDFFAVAGHRAKAQARRLLYVGDITDPNRRCLARGDHDVGNVGDTGDPAQPAHQILLLAAVDVLTADLPVVGIEGFHHLLEAKTELDQALRVDQDLELL